MSRRISSKQSGTPTCNIIIITVQTSHHSILFNHKTSMECQRVMICAYTPSVSTTQMQVLLFFMLSTSSKDARSVTNFTNCNWSHAWMKPILQEAQFLVQCLAIQDKIQEASSTFQPLNKHAHQTLCRGV